MLKIPARTILAAGLLFLLAACEKAPELVPVADLPKVDVEAFGYSVDGLEALDRYVVAKSTHSMRVTVGGKLLYSHGPHAFLDP